MSATYPGEKVTIQSTAQIPVGSDTTVERLTELLSKFPPEALVGLRVYDPGAGDPREHRTEHIQLSWSVTA